MATALSLTGNASSVHASARRLIEDARAQVAALVGAEAKHVTFASGATEANMLVLTPALEIGGRKEPRDRLFVSSVEHPSVRSGGRFARDSVEELPVDGDGCLDLAELERRIARAERPLVSVMLANNETGVIQPIPEIAGIVHAVSGLLHVDAAQGAGRIECQMADLKADLISLSAHKLGGPQGVGALVRRSDIHIGEPLITGGGQERGSRAGTERRRNCRFGAAAMAAAATWRLDAIRMTKIARPGGSRHQDANAAGDFRIYREAAQHHAVRGSRLQGGDGDNRL